MSFKDNGTTISQEQRKKGRGKLNVLEAVNWGFSTAWHNPRVWILGTFLMFLGVLATVVLVGAALWGAEALIGRDFSLWWAQEKELPEGFGPGISLLPLLITPFLYAGALAQVDRAKIGYRDFFQRTHYWKVILVSVVGSVFWAAVEYLFSAAFPADPAAMEDASAWYVLGSFVGSLIQLVLVILTQLLTLAWTWYVSDGYGIGEAVQQGSAAVWHNFFRLAVLFFVGFLVMVLGIAFTFGLGALLLIPASLLMTAHLCRQANGGLLPEANRV